MSTKTKRPGGNRGAVKSSNIYPLHGQQHDTTVDCCLQVWIVGNRVSLAGVSPRTNRELTIREAELAESALSAVEEVLR